jgi:two-component system response regulator AlgR
MCAAMPLAGRSARNPLQLLIVDDEAFARMRLNTLLVDLGGEIPLGPVAQAADAQQALAWLGGNPCDVALLDIQMPGMNGMQLAAQIAALPRPPAVVFVTAHAEHALSAFELDAVDYLTKPVRIERLRAALLRAMQRRSGARPTDERTGDDVLVVSDRGRISRVPIADVLYLKAELKYVTLRTAAHTYVLDDALTDLETRLGSRFVRIHRNALVARHAVRALERRVIDGDEEGWAVCIAPLDEWLAVSRRQVTAVREALIARPA